MWISCFRYNLHNEFIHSESRFDRFIVDKKVLRAHKIFGAMFHYILVYTIKVAHMRFTEAHYVYITVQWESGKWLLIWF